MKKTKEERCVTGKYNRSVRSNLIQIVNNKGAKTYPWEDHNLNDKNKSFATQLNVTVTLAT